MKKTKINRNTNNHSRVRRSSHNRIDKTNKDLIAIRDENKDGYIVLKQESLYKPLLIVFGIFLFVMVVIFPTSIFDELWGPAMTIFRNMVSWASLSAVATLLPLPVSFCDVRLIGVIGNPIDYSNLYVALLVGFIVLSDTFFAFVGYRFTKTLRKLFANKTKESDEKKTNDRFKKYGNLAMFIGASTPLPFTLMVYTAGALKLPKKGFIPGVLFGRIVKYSMIAVPMRLFGFDLIAWGLSLWSSLIEGNLNVAHYIIFSLVGLFILWLVLSILKTIKKDKVLPV